jgi:hypothetical protein
METVKNGKIVIAQLLDQLINQLGRSLASNKLCNENKGGVSQCGLAIYILKKYLIKAKEELWNSNM